ncbi:MAG: GDP-mannose 4,6-dehydratase, partial [Fibrobacteres bacterium]|nr:GDP-mannose 4,6-dehydratase [Fibrobacterota bacterium]
MANKILITGGAGFIGSSIARSFAQDGCQITILDDLSRLGSRRILKKLLADQRNIVFEKNDISKNSSVLKEAVKNKDLVFHFAGQVAVNQSISNPGND